MKKNILTKSPEETKKLGKNIALKILKSGPKKRALVIGLEGDLGTGKTVFLQGFAKGLGITEKVLSPTFILIRRFFLHHKSFKNFYHIDCYRLESEKDVEVLNLGGMLSNPLNIITIEWSEKIKRVLPKDIIRLSFKHLEENKREIVFDKF